MVGIPETILFALFVIVPVGCLTNWYDGLRRLADGQPLIPYRQRDTVPWGLVDLGIVLFIVAVTAGVGVQMVQKSRGIDATAGIEKMTPDEQATTFVTFGTATLFATVLGFGWLFARYQMVAIKHAFDITKLGSDIELGCRWFLMLVAPVVLLQLILTRWFPTKHPLIEMLKNSGDLSFLPIATYAAVVAAPIFEETFFRLFLQGWLEKLQITMLRTGSGMDDKADRDAVLMGGASSSQLPANASLVASLNRSNSEFIEESSSHFVADSEPESDFDSTTQRPVLWLPILVSSGLFAIAHFSHGPDWIPLFFLAIGLGYLYQRTGRIQACIVVHILVNALGVLQLWVYIRQP